MKHLKIVILMLLFAATGAYAQTRTSSMALTPVTPAGTYKSTPDTTSNVDTTYLVLRNGSASSIKPFDEYNDVVYSWNIVPSITGTTTGTVIAQGSMTGTFSNSASPISDWVPLVSGTLQTADFSSTSVSGTTRSYYHFIIPNCLFKYVRLRFISAGTQTSVINGTVTVLRH